MNARFDVIPLGYTPKLDLKQTEKAIKQLKDFFERGLAEEINLHRVTSPLFVRPETGLSNTLGGRERPISFEVPALAGEKLELIISQAKWKRMALYRYGFVEGEGLYTDMNSIRRDEILDNLHSLYVDQWDWEKNIPPNERNEETLKKYAHIIFDLFLMAEDYVHNLYPQLEKQLPQNLFYISAQELEDLYPEQNPSQRIESITQEKKAVFISKIGYPLKSGAFHTHRAPDYDDWELNGDFRLWFPLLKRSMELSSMGIRVNPEALEKQLHSSGDEKLRNFPYHQLLLSGAMPESIGGGIGQSRLCMYFLQKAHIGEVQSSVWPDDIVKLCVDHQIPLL